MISTGMRFREPANTAQIKKPIPGDVVSDRAGFKYIIVSVGLKYARCQKFETRGDAGLIKLQDIFQTGQQVTL